MNSPVDHAALALSLYETACETHKRQDWRLACHALAKSLKQALASSAAMPAPAPCPAPVEAVQVAPVVKAKGGKAKAPAKAKDTSALTGANLKAVLRLIPAVQVKDKLKDTTRHPWNCALFTAWGDSLTVRRTTPECEVVATFEAPGIGQWEACGNVQAILSGLQAGPVILAKQNALFGITMTQGGATRQIPGTDNGDYPERQATGEIVAPLDIDPRALSFVAPAMSKEETRFYLQGAYFHVATDKGPKGKETLRLNVVATDGHRLQLWSEPLGQGAEKLPGSIVRMETIHAMITLASFGPLRAGFSISHIVVEAGNVTLTARHIDGSFPDYPRVIPRDNKGRAKIDSAEWGKAIAPFAKHKGVHHTFASASLALKTGWGAPEEVESMAVCSGPDIGTPFIVGLNPAYVRAMCDAMGETGLTIEYDDTGSPVLIRPDCEPEGVKRLAVLMPLRFPKEA